MVMIQRYDVCVSPYGDALTQQTFEVDAVGEEEAMEAVRSVFGQLLTINSITIHHENKQKPVTFLVKLKNVLKFGR